MADEQVGEPETTTPPVEPEKVQEPTPEELAKAKLEEDLINLGKAKTEALSELARIREDKQKAKKGSTDEELPKIDLEDPSTKAWDNRIRETVQPVQQELEKAREEVRSFALQRFLKEKPALAKDPTKVKELMNVYDRLHTASERTTEGVLMDLDMAYGAITYKEREAADYQERFSRAQADEQFSQAAISKGATSYQTTRDPKKKPYSKEEEQILANWENAGAPKI